MELRVSSGHSAEIDSGREAVWTGLMKCKHDILYSLSHSIDYRRVDKRIRMNTISIRITANKLVPYLRNSMCADKAFDLGTRGTWRQKNNTGIIE